jgi:SMI1 / KNR4 family (SUKH-1)
VSGKDIARIEAALGCRLPVGYRNFLARHTDEVERLKQAMPVRAVLWTDPAAILRANRPGWIAEMTRAFGATGPWAGDTIVVGDNGGGDYFFVYRKRSPAGVWHWEHSSKEVSRVSPSFAAYLAELRRDAKRGEWQ